MKFNEKLIKLRKTSGYTQEDLAEKLSVSRQAVSRWESGETTPDIKTLLVICEIFHVSADYMIHDDYASDEDIPVVKEKSDELKAEKEWNRQMYLFSAIAFAIAAFCGIISSILSPNPAQFVLSCFNTIILLFLCVIQCYNYFKKK